jgi:hypothetical protein
MYLADSLDTLYKSKIDVNPKLYNCKGGAGWLLMHSYNLKTKFHTQLYFTSAVFMNNPGQLLAGRGAALDIKILVAIS